MPAKTDAPACLSYGRDYAIKNAEKKEEPDNKLYEVIFYHYLDKASEEMKTEVLKQNKRIVPRRTENHG